MTIGDKIKSLRKAAGMTQTELGNKLGVKTNAVSKWECGRVEDIPMSKIKAMAKLFNVKISCLIDDEIEINCCREQIEQGCNLIRIAARDGSYSERYLTDEQCSAIKAIIAQMRDASDDL